MGTGNQKRKKNKRKGKELLVISVKNVKFVTPSGADAHLIKFPLLFSNVVPV